MNPPNTRQLPASADLREGVTAVAMALRPHQAAQLWVELQKKEAAGLAYQRARFDEAPASDLDPLTPDERALYQVLTKRLTYDAAVAAITVSESKP